MSRVFKFLLFLNIILLFVSAVAALNFDVYIEPVKDRIYLDEVAYYNLTIVNFAPTDEIYEISTPDISWRISTTPIDSMVEGNSLKSFLLAVDPLTYVTVGAHEVGIKVKSSTTKEFLLSAVPVYLKSYLPDTRTYEPSIDLKVIMDTKIDAREVVLLEVSLRNRNALDIDSLTLKIQSNLINKESSFHFAGLEEKTDEFLFYLNATEKPQKDTLTVTLLVGDKVINQVVKSFEIISYADIIIDEKPVPSFLKTRYSVSVFNDGNIEKETIYKKEVPLLLRLVTFTQPKYEILKEENKKYLAWRFDLQPQEKRNVNIIINYGIYVYSLSFILIFLILYFVLRSPVIVKKESNIVGSAEEGLTELKVILHIKNRSQKVIENVRITEKTPRLVKFEKDSYVGTLAPEKIIEHNKLGTTVRWYLKSLEPFEERIITYKIKSKLTIVGGFSLPKVIVRFDTSRGRERVTYSNRYKIKVE